MGRSRCGFLFALVLLACALPAQASAATTMPSDVPTSFWASTQIRWSVANGWVPDRLDGTFAPGRPVTRLGAARVLAEANYLINRVPMQADPYAQAVDAGWILPGTAAGGTITQLEFDRGIVHMLNLEAAAGSLMRLKTADGWRPTLPIGFGAEQVVRDVGARWNVPFGADNWETWPSSILKRANLAVQAYQLGHLSSWWQSSVATQLNVVNALPKYPPLKQAVIGFALKYAGAPYVWGGTSDQPQTLFGLPAAGGFDCSGFVWWVMKEHTYTANGTTWSGNAKIPWRSTYDMAAHIPIASRIPYANLIAGDILFWSSSPHGVLTASSTVYHTGIYLGNGWTINSHGDGAGVTIDYMGPGAGWYHDAFAFGWRVMPVGV
jgi:cell wall-associated NlpC family hydrolase